MIEVPKQWNEEADVVVIGFGFAGAATAIAATEAGSSVLLLEKAPEEHKGGNSRVSANIVFWPDDVDKAEVYLKALAGPYLDNISDEMVHVWAEQMHANRAWLEKLGMKPADLPRSFKGVVEFPELAGSECVHMLVHREDADVAPVKIGGERLWRVIEKAVAARRIRTLFDTPVRHLVRDKGEIVGVVAERRGERIAIKANRAVVLTCGGFEANPEMIRNYIQGLPVSYPVGTPYNTGDGVRMGLEIGVDLWHMNNIAGPLVAFKAADIPVAQWLNLPRGGNYLFIAGDGKRFTMEGEPCSVGDRHGKVKRHGVWMQQTLPLPIHMIFDETYRKAGHIGKAAADWDVSNENHYDWSDDNLREVEKGWIKKANSLRELAASIDIEPEALEATAALFNAFALDGSDSDWGRSAGTLAALETPPYYAMPLTPAFVNTQGGPRRDKDAQVIGADGAAIPRLYSAGELGSIYSYLYQGGGNIGECFAFGRIAGTNAAKLPRGRVAAA